MKRGRILSALLFFLMSVISMSLSAQGNSWKRQEERSKRHENSRRSAQKRSDRVQRDEGYRYRQNENEYRKPHHYSKKKHAHRDGHNHHQKYYSGHHYHYPKHQHVHRNYLRCLPAHHYTKVYLDGVVYYHCDGHLYTYHRGYGYLLADVQFHTVRHLPRHCDVRVYDGRRYYYKDGHCYLPQRDGHYQVFSITVAL